MRKLLVVVDYQNDFVNGSLGFPEAEKLEEPICRKIESSRAMGADVVFTFDTHGADYADTQEGKLLPVAHCLCETAGWALHGRVADLCDASSRQFRKPAFGSTELMQFAVENAYEQVELCGLVSNICVLANAVLLKTALPEAEITVDAQCTSCFDRVLNEKTLDVMEGLQIHVTNRMS